MSLAKRYNPKEAEPRAGSELAELAASIISTRKAAARSIRSTRRRPPSPGTCTWGTVYSYSHTDFMARFWRMSGRDVFYPMGFDDNGLPTERLVEKRLGITAAQVGRSAFIEKCLQVSEQAEDDYQALWQRLGLSIDWRYTYRTIDERAAAHLAALLHRPGAQGAGLPPGSAGHLVPGMPHRHGPGRSE